jgi:hypothetical protein
MWEGGRVTDHEYMPALPLTVGNHSDPEATYAGGRTVAYVSQSTYIVVH